MFQRFKHFLNSSISAKLKVFLPAVVIIFFSLPILFGILLLRQHISEHFIAEQEKKFAMLADHIVDRSTVQMMAQAFMGNGLLYIQVTSPQGEILHEESFRPNISVNARRIDSTEPNTKEVRVSHISFADESGVEFHKSIHGYSITAGLSETSLDQLLLKESLILAFICSLAMLAIVVLVNIISQAVTRPIRSLTAQAEEIAKQNGSKKKLAFDNREDEVGQLAKSMNHLITENEKHQTELAEQKVHANLGKMATQVAHDIRSPLSSMRAALGMLYTSKPGDSRQADCFNLLELSAKRLTSIADDLLKKHKGEESQQIIFSLHRVLDELIGEYSGQEQYQEVKFVKKYPSQAIELHGDPTKLQRAFGNIVKNAMEAMEGVGTITVRTSLPSPQPSPTRGEEVCIAISDTGPGMTAETLEKVLLGGHTEGKQDGHGIGTKVVREVVEEFGGIIKAESIVGTGTTFFITLPLPAQETLQTAKREESAIEKLVIRLNEKEPVIVVDDEPSLREQWRMTLADNGVQALLCESYEDVEQQITGNISQTAIVDYHFDNSERDGADVIKMLQGRGFKHLYLCTAEYWKPAIKRLAKDLNVTLCPKPLPKVEVMLVGTRDRHAIARDDKVDVIAKPQAEAIPDSNIKGEGYKVLVIDDDDCLEMAWKMTQKDLKIASLNYFKSLELLQTAGVDPKSYDIAFVDRNFDNSQFHGGQVIDYLKDQGMQKVVVASGWNSDEIKKDPRFARADFISREKIPESLAPYFN